jgi:hypothetical protein
VLKRPVPTNLYPQGLEKIMKTLTLTLALVSFFLGGCAGSAMPNFYNGYYYMAGGKGCSNWRSLSGNRMMCQDDERKDTWAISPMTDQQLQMYRHNQQMEQQQQQQQQRKKTTNTNCYRTYGGGMNCRTY